MINPADREVAEALGELEGLLNDAEQEKQDLSEALEKSEDEVAHLRNVINESMSSLNRVLVELERGLRT